MDFSEVFKHVDHTVLAACSTWIEVSRLCDEAILHHMASVCIPPAFVADVKKTYNGRLRICTVIGFPLGYNTTEVKVFEAEDGVKILNDSLDKRWKNYDTHDKYKNVSLKFNSADIETSIRRADIIFSPTETGSDYTIDQMSDGLKSLFYISL